MTAPVAIVDGYMRKAERALDEARLLMSRQATEGACSRAYYAMHDAAHAALFATGFETPDAIIRTHRSLIAAFGRHLVLGGRIDVSAGRALNTDGVAGQNRPVVGATRNAFLSPCTGPYNCHFMCRSALECKSTPPTFGKPRVSSRPARWPTAGAC